ncbi:uncharacterized protein LOC144324732 [Canis aureus]
MCPAASFRFPAPCPHLGGPHGASKGLVEPERRHTKVAGRSCRGHQESVSPDFWTRTQVMLHLTEGTMPGETEVTIENKRRKQIQEVKLTCSLLGKTREKPKDH